VRNHSQCWPAFAPGEDPVTLELTRLLVGCREVASRWAVKVTEEFLAQGELERRAGGPISPGMDKTLVKMVCTLVGR
jgi:hypothetical protein